jgi:hypothetical protein
MENVGMLTKVGPRRGPSKYQPNTLARLEGTNMSLIVPPPFAIPTLPKNPLSVLMAINVSMLGARAEGICSRAKKVKQTRYSFLRPNVSLSGARNSGPMPSITTNPVVHPITMLLVVSRSSAICWIPGVNMEEARGERMLMAAMTATLAILVRCDHWRGFSGSSSVKLKSSRVSLASPSSRWSKGSLSPPPFCVGLLSFAMSVWSLLLPLEEVMVGVKGLVLRNAQRFMGRRWYERSR